MEIINKTDLLLMKCPQEATLISLCISHGSICANHLVIIINRSEAVKTAVIILFQCSQLAQVI